MNAPVIEAFLRSGSVVCPFARQRVILVEVEAEARRSRKALLHVARRFARSKGQSLVAIGPVGDYEATKVWARECFLELGVAFDVVSSLTSVEARARAERRVRPELFDDARPTRPMLGCEDQPLFAICMAPVYPERHPRHAPLPIVVVTRVSDVAAVAREVRLAIRARAAARYGGDYDADDLMLPRG